MPRKKPAKLMVDLKPFSEYLHHRIERYEGKRYRFAEVLGISSHKLNNYMDGIVSDGKRKGQVITKVDACDVDKCTIKLGDHAVIDGPVENPTLILIT